MAERSYVFDDVDVQREYDRLRAIELCFDPDSQRRLNAAGIGKGSLCLEVGPGTGSIARWMAAQTRPSGHVTAIEINPRFLKNERSFEIVHGDVLEIPLTTGKYDIVHARYVLVHIPQYRKALDKMVRALKPGGRIVLEEPDFTTAKAVNGTAAEIESVRRVNQSIEYMYRAKNISPSFGTLLPSLANELGLTELQVEMNTPLVKGSDGVAEVMALSAEQLADRYLSTGQASDHDIRTYAQFCRNSERWAVYYATVAVTARKPG